MGSDGDSKASLSQKYLIVQYTLAHTGANWRIKVRQGERSNEGQTVPTMQSEGHQQESSPKLVGSGGKQVTATQTGQKRNT